MKRLGFSFLVLVLSVSTESFPVPAQRLVDHPFPSAGDAEVKQAGNEMAPAPPPLCSKIPPQRLYCKIHSHTKWCCWHRLVLSCWSEGGNIFTEKACIRGSS